MKNFGVVLCMLLVAAVECPASTKRMPEGSGEKQKLAFALQEGGAPSTTRKNSNPLDACKTVPGDAVASALGGKLAEIRGVKGGNSPSSKCVYTIVSGGPENPARRIYVLWLMPPQDFDSMKKLQEDPVKKFDKLGDDAFITFHPENQRYDLMTVKRGKIAIEVTGEDVDSIRKVAQQALSRF
jgi:hypothetical protein